MYKLWKAYSRTFHSSHPTGLLLVSAYLCHNTWVELSISFVYSSNDAQAAEASCGNEGNNFCLFCNCSRRSLWTYICSFSYALCVYTGTMESYLCAGATAVVLSDAIFDKSAMTNHDYTEISKRSAAATALVSSIRRRLWENFPGRLNFLSCRKWWINLCKRALWRHLMPMYIRLPTNAHCILLCVR